ncbi:16625_t:CDS:2, partial [Cetraspora pellucida]
MSLSSEAKKCLRESLQQQCLNQKLAEYNEAKKLFTGLTNFNYEPDHKKHTYYKYWLASNSHIDSRAMAGKGYTVIDHLSEVYRIPDAHEYIDENQPLRLVIDIDTRQKSDPSDPKLPSLDNKKINHRDLISRILVTCADALSLISEYYRELKGFTKKVIEL